MKKIKDFILNQKIFSKCSTKEQLDILNDIESKECILNNSVKISYICDRQKCELCSYPECKRTTDINHAVNFKNYGDLYLEEKENE